MSKRSPQRTPPPTKGTPHPTTSSGNRYEYGNPERAKMRSELVPRDKPATTIKATMAKMQPSERYRFGIIIIEPQPPLSLALQRDIHFLKFPHTALHRAESLAEARTLLNNEQIELVMVSLNLPKDALADFFRTYPSHRRPFALILTETSEHLTTESQALYGHYLRTMNLIAEERASGYLLLGASSNEHLRESLERARRWVQERLVQEYQERVIESLGDYFEHPAIAARQRLANIGEQGTHLPLSATSGELSVSPKMQAQQMQTQQTIPFDKIVYLQGDGKYLYVWHFNDNSALEALYLPKQDILTHLPPFILNVHKSYWVNVAYIREVNDEEVVLLTRDRIPIARRERKAIDNIIQQMRPESFVIPILQSVITRSTTRRT